MQRALLYSGQVDTESVAEIVGALQYSRWILDADIESVHATGTWYVDEPDTPVSRLVDRPNFVWLIAGPKGSPFSKLVKFDPAAL